MTLGVAPTSRDVYHEDMETTAVLMPADLDTVEPDDRLITLMTIPVICPVIDQDADR